MSLGVDKKILAIVGVIVIAGLLLVFQAGRAPAKIRVGDLPVVQALPFYVALDKGYFKEEGVEVERVRFDSPNQIIDALLQNQVDIGSTSVALGITGIANSKNPGKLEVYAISGGTKEVPNEDLLVPVDSNLTSISQLKGKKLGILAGTIQWKTITRDILASNGLDMNKDVTIVELAPSLQVPALASHQVDALLALEPIPTLAIQKKVGKILVKGPAEQVIADPLYPGAGVVSTRFATENPEATAKIIKAITRAIKDIRVNPDEAKLHLKGYTPLTDDLISQAPVSIFKTCSELMQQDRDSVQKFYDIFTKYGVVSETMRLDSFLYCKSSS